jgi:hypothetical protein
MTDEQLAEMSQEVDDNLFKWLNDYGASPLSICAVVLARLTWMAKLSGCEKDYFELLKAPQEVVELHIDKKIH